jgi:hypothetical protein
LGERLVRNEEVRGSIPLSSTTISGLSRFLASIGFAVFDPQWPVPMPAAAADRPPGRAERAGMDQDYA